MEEGQVRKKRRLKKRIWRELPRSVLINVLSCLPLECLMRLRFLCRELRDLAGTRLFQELWKNSEPRRQPGFLIVKYRYTNRKAARCYSTGTDSWFNVPTAWFMPKDAFLLRDAFRGLTAARMVDQITVGNPVSGKWVQFKPPAGCQKWATTPWTLLVSPDSATFKLILDSFVYDSRRGNWQLVSLPGDTAYGPILRDEAGERYYYLCKDEGQVKLIRGSVEEPSKTEAIGRWMDESSYPVRHALFNYRGADQVGMMRETLLVAGSLTACVFDEVKEEWIEKSQLPRELWMRLVNERTEQKKVEKGAHRKHRGDVWQMVSCGSRYVGLLAYGSSGLILFDCFQDSWRWVDDPVKFDPLLRQTPLFGFELRL